MAIPNASIPPGYQARLSRFAELMHVEDELMPEVSRVYAAPAITSGQGHGLVALLNVMPPDVRRALINAFDAELRARWNKDLQSALAELEGAFLATRDPFEHGIDLTRYNLDHFMGPLISSVVSRRACNRRTVSSGSEAA